MIPSHELLPQPSAYPAEWRQALSEGDLQGLRTLAENDLPGASLLQMESHINGMYAGASSPLAVAGAAEIARASVAPVHDVVRALRKQLGWQAREFDLALLRMVRQSSALSPVLGAGVSMGAGGPSWSTLVRRLLEITLERGLELRGPVKRTEQVNDDGSQHVSVEFGVVDARHYTDAQRAQAQEVLVAVRQHGSATDVETLMRGAQLCLDLCGQELFRLVTGELYGSMKAPSPTHHAIAKLAGAQHVPGRGPKPLPGWDTIITYNFDSLMSEALAEARFPHVACAVRTDSIVTDPDALSRTSDWHVPIYHLHGYTPRRLFLITDTRFVFSTSQYLQAYKDQRLPMLRHVVDRVLANPVHIALYIGCSFADDAMNGLLAQAFERWPGRYHYALLQWPHRRDGREPSVDEVEAEAAKYLACGVRPVWFDDFAELPDIVAGLE